MNKYYSIIAFVVNCLNSQIKRHRLTYWIRTQNATSFCLTEIHTTIKDRYFLRVKGWKKVLQANRSRKQAGVTVLMSYKIDFKSKCIRRDRE